MIERKMLIINQDAGYLTVDIANTFNSSQFKTAIITGRLVERNDVLNKSVTIHKIEKYNRKSYFSRFYSWSKAFFQIVNIIKNEYKYTDLLIITNPPFAIFLTFFVSNSFSVLIFDYYVNLFENILPWGKYSFVSLIWKKLHFISLNRAKSVFVLTDGMKNKAETFTKRNDIQLVSLWADAITTNSSENNTELQIIKDFHLSEKFVITYSGNMGYSSGVEHLIEIAIQLKNINQIFFLIMGDGTLRNKIVKLVNDNQLKNCLILDWQTPEDYYKLLKITKLSFVSLMAEDSNDSIPSKVFTYISGGIPILCIAEDYADISKFIEKNQIGGAFSLQNIEKAIIFTKELCNDNEKLQFYKKNILKLSLNHTKQNAQKIVQKF